MCRFVALLAFGSVFALAAGPAHAAERPDKNAFPEFRKGNGALGYGKPDRVVTAVATWQHPAKAALATLNKATVERVEFYKAATYPVFFVRRMPNSTSYRYLLLHETPTMDRWAARILKANAGWAFEIVDDEGTRFRTNAKRVHTNNGCFEMGDEDGFLDD
jgi:hypothetical protein